MGLYDVLDQIIALLRQRKRLTYRLVQREFALDDTTLADLKDELIYAQKLAVDEDNRVLVWTGHGEETTATPALPPQAIPSPPTQDLASVQTTSPGITSRTPDAERRQLTVLFCDLVD